MPHPLELGRQLLLVAAAAAILTVVAGPAVGQATDAEFDALRRAGKTAELETPARERLAKHAGDDVALWHLARAEVHTHEEEFDEAQTLLGAIKPGTDVALAEAARDATSALGLALLDDGQAARARKVFERQVAAYPRYAFAHFGLGRVLLEQKELDGAIAALERALQLDPRSRAHYRLGIAYQGKGDAARALAMFQQFLGYSPDGRAADDARKRIEQLTKAG